MPVPGNVCTRCGFDNSTSRGACVMCLSLLSERGTGQKCASCGAENPRNALFCHNCANAFTNAVAVPGAQALAEMVTAAVGGFASAGDGDTGYDDANDFDSPGDYVDDYAYEESVPVAADTKPPVVAVAPEEVPGPVMDSVLSGAMAELAPDEDFVMTPPPGVVEQPVATEAGLDFDADEDFAMPTAPGIISEPEPIAPPPPPPPPAMAELEVDQDDFLPPPPPPGVVDETEDFLPPPPPPGVVEDADEFLPPPPPPAPASAPAVPPAAPPAAEAAEGESDFGMWELNYENEDEEEEEK